MKTLILILSPIILASCCLDPVYTQGKLRLPPELVLTDKHKVKDGEWACLAKEKKERAKCKAFQALGKMDVLKSKRIETLKNIIRSTHK